MCGGLQAEEHVAGWECISKVMAYFSDACWGGELDKRGLSKANGRNAQCVRGRLGRAAKARDFESSSQPFSARNSPHNFPPLQNVR